MYMYKNEYILFIFVIIITVLLINTFYRKPKQFNIAIVGNGPSVMGDYNGKFIDSCDIVVRFNMFQTESYEDHVGSKTDIWMINLRNLQDLNPKFIDKYSNSNCNILFENNISMAESTIWNLINHNLPKKDVKLIERQFFNSLQLIYNPRGFNPHPSLGIQGLYKMLSQYPHSNFYLFGFDNFKSSNIHYFHDDKQLSSRAHPSRIEERITNYFKSKFNITHVKDN